MIGTTLLHYRIVGTLGSGGMGEVYAAEDTRLNRRVALKLLPPATAIDRERLHRFRREAQAIAAPARLRPRRVDLVSRCCRSSGARRPQTGGHGFAGGRR